MVRDEETKKLDLMIDKRELRTASIRLKRAGIIDKETHWDNLRFIDKHYKGDVE